MQGSHAELVFYCVLQAAMQIHDFILISQLLCELEQQSYFKRRVLLALLTFSLRFFVHAKRIQTASLEHVQVVERLTALDQLVINVHRTPNVCEQVCDETYL
jgi:hypothetical protein